MEIFIRVYVGSPCRPIRKLSRPGLHTQAAADDGGGNPRLRPPRRQPGRPAPRRPRSADGQGDLGGAERAAGPELHEQAVAAGFGQDGVEAQDRPAVAAVHRPGGVQVGEAEIALVEGGEVGVAAEGSRPGRRSPAQPASPGIARRAGKFGHVRDSSASAGRDGPSMGPRCDTMGGNIALGRDPHLPDPAWQAPGPGQCSRAGTPA
jgi:hypothetical protein